jgi:hypothetical protein
MLGEGHGQETRSDASCSPLRHGTVTVTVAVTGPFPKDDEERTERAVPS